MKSFFVFFNSVGLLNSSFVTAVANDYGYEEIYSRMVEAIGKNGDILLALSTSGNSKNIISPNWL